MGSSISPIIANIVMVDLETELLASFDFVIPWYFRYVDDIILWVPQDKVDIVLYKINFYNPRLQFTYRITSDNTLSFLDIIFIKTDSNQTRNKKVIKNTSGYPTLAKYHKKLNVFLKQTIFQPLLEIIVLLNSLLN